MLVSDCSILVLEDEPAVLALVTASLQSGAYRDVHTADCLRDARALWAENSGRFDLLLTDFSLPDGPAPQFIAELLREKPSLIVVLMSGLPEDALDFETGVIGRIHILPKPFRPSELLGFLKTLLERAIPAIA